MPQISLVAEENPGFQSRAPALCLRLASGPSCQHRPNTSGLRQFLTGQITARVASRWRHCHDLSRSLSLLGNSPNLWGALLEFPEHWFALQMLTRQLFTVLLQLCRPQRPSSHVGNDTLSLRLTWLCHIDEILWTFSEKLKSPRHCKLILPRTSYFPHYKRSWASA